MSQPNPTIPVHLTQKELELLNRILQWPYSSTLADKLRHALVDIRPIIREARANAKNTKRQIQRQANRDVALAEFFELVKELKEEK